MEETTFDTLLRTAAEQTTRRSARAALVGGALLLTRGEVSEATDKAQRRKKRKKRQRRQASSARILKDVSFWVNNRAGTTTATGARPLPRSLPTARS